MDFLPSNHPANNQREAVVTTVLNIGSLPDDVIDLLIERHSRASIPRVQFQEHIPDGDEEVKDGSPSTSSSSAASSGGQQKKVKFFRTASGLPLQDEEFLDYVTVISGSLEAAAGFPVETSERLLSTVLGYVE